MCPHGSRFSALLPLLLTLLIVPAGWSQTGTVVWKQKISDLLGGFTGALDDTDEFGGAVAGLGDLDGDGPAVAAFAVGAVGDDDGGTSRGAVYILFVDASGTVLSHRKISDTESSFSEPLDNTDEFGSALAYLGDLDGAGPSVAALAVGAVLDDDGGTNRGALYVLFLDATGDVLSHQKISDTQGGFPEPLGNADEFGGTLAALGDLDGAGPSAIALAVGAVGDDDGGSSRGAVYILFLAPSGQVLSFQKISDTQGGFAEPLGNADEFGSSVASLGDLDGPGGSAGALAVGAVGDDDGGTNRGAVYVLFLDPGGSVSSYQKISSTQGGLAATLANDDEFGGAVADLGDLDGSGGSVRTLAVGAGFDDSGGADRGAVYVLFLDAGGAVLSQEKISDTSGGLGGGLLDGDQFGGSVASLGDVDGPGGGARTLVVGAAGDDDGGADRGAVYVLSLDGVSVATASPVPGRQDAAGLGIVAPNPFGSTTGVTYSLARAGRVRVEVRDVTGRVVQRLLDRDEDAGEHRIVWNGVDEAGRRVPAGVYFMRMTLDGRAVGSRKVQVVR